MAIFQRNPNTFINDKAYGRDRNAPMLNLEFGGNNGWLPDWPSYISNTPYVSRNLILRVLAAPKGFALLPEPEKWYQALKAVIELHPESVEGFSSNWNIDVAGTKFGLGGNQQEVVTNVSYDPIAPQLAYVDKYGRPISAFYKMWTSELLMNPDTKVPDIVTRLSARGQNITLLPDFTSATIIAFEPDPTMTKVDKAWLVADFKPKANLAPEEGSRKNEYTGELLQFTQSFTGIAQRSKAVNDIAQAMLDAMVRTNASPFGVPAFTTGLDANVADYIGYTEKLSQAAASSVISR